MLNFWRQSIGFLALVALTAQAAWAQVAAPDAPAPPKPPAAAAKGVADRAADAAPDTAREAVRDTREAARETTDEARDAAKGARREGREAGRDARETGRDARDAGRATGREARETVRDTRREVRDEIRDLENLRAADIGLWLNARGGADGLIIADVAADGAIAKVGFREGDRIISVNDQKVASEAEFLRFLRAEDLRDQRVKVVVFRGGREQIVYVQPALIYREAVAFDPLWQYGIVVDERAGDRIVVMRVYPRTPAYYAGLRAGDVIVNLGGRRIGALADLADAFRNPDGRVALQVSRGNRTRDIEIDANANVEARTTLRPNVDGETRIDGRGRIEAREGSVEQPGGTRTRIERERPNQPASKPRLGSDPEEATPAPPAERVPAVEKPAVPSLKPGEPAVAPPADVPAIPALPATPAAPKAPRVPRTP